MGAPIKLPDEVRLLEATCDVLSLCACKAMTAGFVEGMTDHEVVTLADETALSTWSSGSRTA